MNEPSKLTTNQVSISLSEIRLLNFRFDDRKRNDEGLYQLFGYHILLSPNEKKAYVGAQVSVSNPEMEGVDPACELTAHFEFALKHKETGRELMELADDDAYHDLKKELAVFFINIAHSTVRGMWFMATRGTLYHEGFDISLPIPDIDRVKLEVRQTPVASSRPEVE